MGNRRLNVIAVDLGINPNLFDKRLQLDLFNPQMQKWPFLELRASLGGARCSAGGQPRPSSALLPTILPFDCTVITVSMRSEKAALGW